MGGTGFLAVPLRAEPAGRRESFRRILLQGQPPAFQALAISAMISLVLLPIAFYFKHVEATVADVV